MNFNPQGTNLKKDNKYICNICFANDGYFLCKKCFESYHQKFREKKEKFGKSKIPEQIENLLKFNWEKSKTLNKKIWIDKNKQILINKINQEEILIKKYKEESEKNNKLIVSQQGKNSRLDKNINSLNKESKKENDFSYIEFNNVNNENFVNGNNLLNENNDINKIKNEIYEINEKIKKLKHTYINKLFNESFIENHSIIKPTDFFNILSKEEQEKLVKNLNFSVLELEDNKPKSKELNLDALKVDIYLKRFNSFFISMFSFLIGAYKKFKINMPYKIEYPKIYLDKLEYKIELKNEELNDAIAVDKAVQGFHLLNINYEFLINFIYGDSNKLKYLFDMTFFLSEEQSDLGSLENIQEESQILLNQQQPKEIDEFVILD